MEIVETHSPEETMALGAKIARELSDKAVLCFFGDLGAGKTTLIKGLIAEVAGVSTDEVQSPTFNYLTLYEGPHPVYHFDLYRLQGVQEFLVKGFEEYLDTQGICCIEWSERIAEILPPEAIHITISHLGQEQRRITIG